MAKSHHFVGCTSKADKAGHTPLHLAVMHDQPEVVKLLVGAKSVRDARDLRWGAVQVECS
jgi:ankyrin repeat protein